MSRTSQIWPLLLRSVQQHWLELISVQQHWLELLSAVKENLKAYCLGWIWKSSHFWTMAIVQGLKKSWMWVPSSGCGWHFLSFGVPGFVTLSDYILLALQHSCGLGTVTSERIWGKLSVKTNYAYAVGEDLIQSDLSPSQCTSRSHQNPPHLVSILQFWDSTSWCHSGLALTK